MKNVEFYRIIIGLICVFVLSVNNVSIFYGEEIDDVESSAGNIESDNLIYENEEADFEEDDGIEEEYESENVEVSEEIYEYEEDGEIEKTIPSIEEYAVESSEIIELETTAAEYKSSVDFAKDANLADEVITVAAVQFNVKGIFGGRSVTFSCETEGADIYYSSTTSTLTTEDYCVENGGSVDFSNFYGTIYARAYKDGVWGNVSRLILKIPNINTPVITQSGNTVEIKTTTPSCFIYYTTDGSIPSINNGARLSNSKGTITVEPGSTLRAIAVRSCFTNSEVVSKYIAVEPVQFTVVGAFGGRNVTFKSSTEGAKIYYSSTTSNLTTDDNCVENGETVLFENFYGTIYTKAYYPSTGKWSNVSRLILKIPVVNTPSITINGTSVTIKDSTPNSKIYYTTDGSEPTMSSYIYTGQFNITIYDTVKAIAVRSCFTNSAVDEYSYMDSVFDNLKEEYPDGTPFTNANKYYWKCVDITGYGCYAFAGIVSDAIFGKDGSRPTKHTNLSNIKVGDHLRLTDSHSVIVMKVEEDGIIVTEGNFNGCVHWGRYISFESIESDEYYIETRY